MANQKYCPFLIFIFYFFHSKLSLGRLVQQKKLEAIQRKATSFMEELTRNEKRASAWKENLRRVGSESNIHTVVLQPQLGLSRLCSATLILSNFWRLEQLFAVLATSSKFCLLEQFLSKILV